MVTMTIRALSNVQCEAVHGPSGTVLRTDAPADVGGDAASFSPTDLLGVGLLSCIMTTMGIVANRHDVDLTGMHGTVDKHMSDDRPRRIGAFTIQLSLPNVPEQWRAQLESAAHHCPVHHSLHPDTNVTIDFRWDA